MPNLTTVSFDYGLARIGIAYGESDLNIAHPLLTIHTTKMEEKMIQIEKIIKEWKPNQLVIGLPLHKDDSLSDFSRSCLNFAKLLKKKFTIPVFLVDERLSSIHAESLLKESLIFGKKQKPYLDQLAATTILQNFFESGYLSEIDDFFQK